MKANVKYASENIFEIKIRPSFPVFLVRFFGGDVWIEAFDFN